MAGAAAATAAGADATAAARSTSPPRAAVRIGPIAADGPGQPRTTVLCLRRAATTARDSENIAETVDLAATAAAAAVANAEVSRRALPADNDEQLCASGQEDLPARNSALAARENSKSSRSAALGPFDCDVVQPVGRGCEDGCHSSEVKHLSAGPGGPRHQRQHRCAGQQYSLCSKSTLHNRSPLASPPNLAADRLRRPGRVSKHGQDFSGAQYWAIRPRDVQFFVLEAALPEITRPKARASCKIEQCEEQV